MYPQRPSMHARDSSGRQVSLLNDEPSRSNDIRYGSLEYAGYHSPDMVRSNSDTSIPSNASSPCTPGLMRATSYDSQVNGDPHSPITPTYMSEFARHSSYSNPHAYKDQSHYDHPDFMSASHPRQPQYAVASRPSYEEGRLDSYGESHGYNDEQYPTPKGGKRYPCRFKESHGCDRTFTTSGHASRHSKIHTAEKAVNCSHPGCQKKFTRADNMKQHLETHYKDRSRSMASQKLSAAKSVLTVPAGVKKPAAYFNGKISRTSSRAENRPEFPPMVDPALFDAQYTASSSFGALSMGSVRDALVSPPMTAAHANGLDALAAAAADYQQIQA